MLAKVSFSLGVMAVVMIAIVVIRDWRRGRTGLGSLVLTRDAQPDRFWYALVLYINLAFAIIWLLQYVETEPPACNPQSEDCVKVIIKRAPA